MKKTIEQVFHEIELKHPRYSTWLCFSHAIIDRKYSKQVIRKAFFKLVDKDDYFEEDNMKDMFNFFFANSHGLPFESKAGIHG
jgi:hypothetical protein